MCVCVIVYFFLFEQRLVYTREVSEETAINNKK